MFRGAVMVSDATLNLLKLYGAMASYDGKIPIYHYIPLQSHLITLKQLTHPIIFLIIFFIYSLTPFNIIINMVKKTKSKSRLDKFYKLAKEQGYRSRAAFKLIQLNNQFHFLENSRVLVDLCAAPGGWLQVAEKFMPMGSIKIGIDLDPIKHIPNVKSFQEDITTQKCIDILKRELKGQKADVFLNDGAPNVGSNWSSDAHNQSELVLQALKLATSFLREGGYFVTKVFRSTDYLSLRWVFEKMFKQVIQTKPKASRQQSAEIFVVCIGYTAPTFLDPNFFNAEFVFKTTEDDHQQEQYANDQIHSMKTLFAKRRQRSGYADNTPIHMSKNICLKAFLEADNPFAIFANYNVMTISAEESEKYLGKVKQEPIDLKEMLGDLKQLGVKEVSSLLKWRSKLRGLMNNELHKKEKKQRAPKKEQEEDDSDEELNKELVTAYKEQRKTDKKIKDRQDKLLLFGQKLGDNHKHDEELSDLGDILDQESDVDNAEYIEVSDDGKDKAPKPTKEMVNPKMLGDNIEEMYEQRREKKLAKQREELDTKRKKKEANKIKVDVDESKYKATRMVDEEEIQTKLKKNKAIDQNLMGINKDITFKNPLAEFGEDIYLPEEGEEVRMNVEDSDIDPNERVPGEMDDDDAYVIKKPLSALEIRKKRVAKKDRKLQQKEDQEKADTKIEIVPRKTMEDYDIDSLAETLAIAKKMLRTRQREEIIDGSYGRFSFQDHEDLPTWFTQDEKKHNYKSLPITKEEFQREKNRLMAINAKVPKKIMEAKIRKKMKMQRKLKRAKQQAQKVMEQEGVEQYHKMKEVNRLYRKEFRESKQDKKYIVSTRAKAAPPGKSRRGIKFVDTRLKKDSRKTKKIKKTRHTHRKNTKKARF